MDLRNERTCEGKEGEGGAREKERRRRDCQSRTHRAEPETRGADTQIIRRCPSLRASLFDVFGLIQSCGSETRKRVDEPLSGGGRPWLLQPRGMH